MPRGDAARATEILTELLLARPGDARDTTRRGDRQRVAAGIAGALRGRRGVALAALVAGLAGLPLLQAFMQSRADAAAATRADAIARRGSVDLQILAVDDDTAIDNYAKALLPRGATIDSETAPTGPGRRMLLNYVKVVRGEGESMAAARARLEAWTSSLTLPEGDRAMVGKILEEGAGSKDDEAGWRTYLVKGTAVITGADVATAEAKQNDQSTHVNLQLTPRASDRFAAFTAANRERRLVIVIDGEVKSAPVIRSRIPGGRVQISIDSGSPEEQLSAATKLAATLRGE